MSYNYQSLESKQWSSTVILGLTAVISVSVGVAAGLVTSQSSSALYVPTSTGVTTAPAVAVAPSARYVSRVAAATDVPVEADEQMEVNAPVYVAESTIAWGPVAALVALPTAIAAFLLRKADQPKALDVETAFSGARLATAGVAASLVLGASAMAPPPSQAADISGLVPCAESKKFQKNLAKEVKTLEKRQKLYTKDSPPYMALEATKARTQARFDKYAKKGLLCGTDGLPHLISDPGLAVRYGHAGETLIPTVGFLYVAGYIGTAGRTYLQEIGSRQKPTESEIIIDVPLATSIAFKSWDWPGKAVNELMSGQLTAPDSNVPVSPR